MSAVNAGLSFLYWRIGKRLAEKNFLRMVQFVRQFPREQFVASLIQHLSWSHEIAVLPFCSRCYRSTIHPHRFG